MDKTTSGWVIFLAAFGMMLGMVAMDIATLKTLADAKTPAFIGSVLGHIAATIAAFVGGKIIPEARAGKFTRADDPVHANPPNDG